MQEVIKDSSSEIEELKKSASALRDELMNLKYSKQEAVQSAVLSSSSEIKQLKGSTQTLRDELDKVINNYEKKIKSLE